MPLAITAGVFGVKTAAAGGFGIAGLDAFLTTFATGVTGLGIDTFNGRPDWGLPEQGRLSGFSNMNSALMWGGGSFDGLNVITGRYHAVIAQELSHLLFLRDLRATAERAGV